MSQVSYKQEFVSRARRLVIKIGSAVISDAGGLRPEIIARLATEIDALVRAGREVVVVTSGARAAGKAWRCGRGGAPGGGGNRTDRADGRMGARFRRRGTHSRATLADPSGSRRARAAQQRDSYDPDPARSRRNADSQRERHRRGRRNPHGRQRRALLAGGRDGAGAAPGNPE